MAQKLLASLIVVLTLTTGIFFVQPNQAQAVAPTDSNTKVPSMQFTSQVNSELAARTGTEVQVRCLKKLFAKQEIDSGTLFERLKVIHARVKEAHSGHK